MFVYKYNKQTFKGITDELIHRRAFQDNLTAVATILKQK